MGVNPTALLDELDKDLLESQHLTSTQRFAASALRSKLFSKFQDLPEATLARADSAAVAKFLLVNDRCKEWSHIKAYNSFFWASEVMGEAKAILHRFFNPGNREPLWSTYEEVLTYARVGPGSSRGSNGTDFYTKLFSSNLTGSHEGLYGAYRAICGRHPTWADAERRRCSAGYSFQVVTSSKLQTVPKNVDISRVICVEPSLNTFYQLGVGEIITQRLGSFFGIRLEDQASVNRELARVGSLDDQLVTIDLESASDSLSVPMMRWLLDPFTYTSLERLTCRTGILPTGEQVLFNMLSTMGNGFTFPLQTAVFSAIVCAAYRFLGLHPGKAGKHWSVFGDDIICETRVAQVVSQTLEAFGFVINQHKSFFEGPFRESCGRDYFNGHNVRSVYLKSLKTAQTRYSAMNLLNRWSAQVGINLPNTIRALLSTVRFIPVPWWDNDDAGVKVPLSIAQSYLAVNKDYQSYEYTCYRAKPHQLKCGEVTIRVPRGQKKRVHNPSALLLSLLNGVLENGSISVRHNMVWYRRRLAIAPNWDDSPPPLLGRVPAASDFASEVERLRWRTVVEATVK